jgi:hypothetical protein
MPDHAHAEYVKPTSLDFGGASGTVGVINCPTPADAMKLVRQLVFYLTPALMPAVLLIPLWSMEYRSISDLFPVSPDFWPLFVILYLMTPAADRLIYGRLWFPFPAFSVLTRKFALNELTFGLHGEAYFYGWARRKIRSRNSLSAAMKDVAALDAITGNLIALAMIALAAPFSNALPLGAGGKALVVFAIFIVLSSTILLVARKRCWCLSWRDRGFVAGIHTVRTVTSLLLMVTSWHFLLPEVALTSWFVLATSRQLLARLPYVPNRDVTLAIVANFVLGAHAPTAAAITLVATLFVGAHALANAVSGTASLRTSPAQ